MGDTPSLQAGQAGWSQPHPGLPQPHTLHICRTFRLHLDTETGQAALLEQDRVSLWLLLPVVCTILVGSPVSFLIPPAQKGAQEEGHPKSCLPRTSPWAAAKLPTLLSPCKLCQALAELYHQAQPSSGRTRWSPTMCHGARTGLWVHSKGPHKPHLPHFEHVSPFHCIPCPC